jgi:hypothetical protein
MISTWCYINTIGVNNRHIVVVPRLIKGITWQDYEDNRSTQHRHVQTRIIKNLSGDVISRGEYYYIIYDNYIKYDNCIYVLNIRKCGLL